MTNCCGHQGRRIGLYRETHVRILPVIVMAGNCAPGAPAVGSSYEYCTHRQRVRAAERGPPDAEGRLVPLPDRSRPPPRARESKRRKGFPSGSWPPRAAWFHRLPHALLLRDRQLGRLRARASIARHHILVRPGTRDARVLARHRVPHEVAERALSPTLQPDQLRELPPLQAESHLPSHVHAAPRR